MKHQPILKREVIEAQLAQADAEVAKFARISNPLSRSEVTQFVRCLDALLSRPKLARKLKEMSK